MKCPRCGRELSETSPGQASCPVCDAGPVEAINATGGSPVVPQQASSVPSASSPRMDATVDLPVAPHQVHNVGSTASRRLDATVDIPIAPQEPKKPISATAVIIQTVEVDSMGQAVEQDSTARGPVSQPAGTDARRVEQLWRQSISADARPGMTIKQDTRATSTGKSLMVQQRSMREPNAAASKLTDYELLEVLGEGGMGVVYTARQASIDRIVAVKMLKAGMKDDDAHRGKFFSEAVVTGDLEHPNIVPIYDMGANESGALFYSMKRVHGTPWNEVIAAKSLAENLRILMSVSDAIAFAHVRGIVHRDLKPENVMLGDFGEVLVMDWGIAMATAAFGKAGSILQSSGVGGTPAYMAPELASGQIDRIGPASDIYLLGAILYEILTGYAPHTGKNVMQCLVAAARNEIQPTDKSGELMDIARKAMATSIEDRYASVLEFQEAIRQYQAHSESIVLSSRAEEDLAKSQQTRDYQDFSRALFGFQEAVALWDGNGRAGIGIVQTQAAYAACALEKGDYDLGLSLLDPGQPEHASLHAQLTAAQHERDSRALRLKKLKRLAAVLAAVSFAILAVALVLILQQKREADQQRGIAVQQTGCRRSTTNDRRDRTEEGGRRAAACRTTAEQGRGADADRPDRANASRATAAIRRAATRVCRCPAAQS
jgi:serine/threonine protein kinase